MRFRFLLFFLFVSFSLSAQTVSICSWNIQNFGQSKSDSEILFIAKTIQSFDVIAIQEVVAGISGPPAVARLCDQMNRMGGKWQYTISHGTSGDRYSKERYAFIWNILKVKMNGEAWLDAKYNLEINREPFFARFQKDGKLFTVASFHAVPAAKQPEKEIKLFRFLPARYPTDKLIFCGDFNIPQSHSVFNPLKLMGYMPALVGKKTTLKQKCLNNDCLASEFDNFFYNRMTFRLIKAGVVLFFTKFRDIKEARQISDHLPVFLELELGFSTSNNRYIKNK